MAACLVAGAAAPARPPCRRRPHLVVGRCPLEAGRVQLVRRTPDGVDPDVLPEGFSARTRVHEYGGERGPRPTAPWCSPTSTTSGCTASIPTARCRSRSRPSRARSTASGSPTWCSPPKVPGWSPCAKSHGADRLDPAATEAVNEIVAVPTAGGPAVVLVSGPDFVANPAVAPDAARLAWWKRTTPTCHGTRRLLGVAALDLSSAGPGGTSSPCLVQGVGARDAILQPQWLADSGSLSFLSDRSGWWNPYRCSDGSPDDGRDDRSDGGSDDRP